MKKVNHLILYFIILSHLSVSGQYVLEWSKSYPAEYPGFINDIQISNDGGYIAIGEYLTQKSDMGWFAFADLCILKLDAEGKLEWKKIYGGSGIDNGYAIQQTKDFLSKETELIEVGPEPLKASTSWPRQVHR